jgi:hypothetical protein
LMKVGVQKMKVRTSICESEKLMYLQAFTGNWHTCEIVSSSGSDD